MERSNWSFLGAIPLQTAPRQANFYPPMMLCVENEKNRLASAGILRSHKKLFLLLALVYESKFFFDQIQSSQTR